MKNKILKMSIAIVVLITLTMTNFIFVGASFVSYATSRVETNHQNVEFDAYLKDENGNKQTAIEKTFEGEETIYLQLSVKKEGYFNGNISIENSNFKLKSSDNEYVNKIEENTIILNQINAGATIEIPVKIEPIKDDKYDIGLLNVVSKINLSGIYRDSTQKDINIKSSRNINLIMTENNTGESVLNDINVITNKITKVSGEEKRVLQLSLNLGLIDNNYPMKEIISKLDIKNVDNETPEIVKVDNLNNMTSSEYKNENSSIEIKLKNDEAQDNKVIWKAQGNENIIVTYIYNKDVKLENVQIKASEKVTLYNQKVMTSEKEFSLDNQEKDEIIQVSSINSENEMYKGKIYSGIDRQFKSNTKLNVNLANVAEYININEKASTYNVNNSDANVIYNKTTLKKEKFDKIFGQNGVIDFINENGEIVATVDNSTSMDEEGNIVIDYTGKEPKELQIKTTTPISEGSIEFNHVKIIKSSNRVVIKEASEINSNIEYSYNMYEDEKEEMSKYSKGIQKEISTKITLNNTKTEAKLEINKDNLSTVIENNVEIKAILKTNSEQNDLYKNPTIQIELPEEIEKIDINSINLLYEDELKIKDYNINGKILTINLSGEQTQYKQSAIEGATIIANVNISINKKAAAKETQINMTYLNENAVSYNEGNIGREVQGIKIVAPKDVTTINSIKDLSIETIGQEETRKVTIARGDKARQLETNIEIINNNAESIENVRTMGTFPTRNDENNIDTKIVEPVNVENAKIYYTENENATEDIQNSENAWTESISDNTKVRKYLIEIDKIEAGESIQGTYKFEIPENLEYNEQAKQGYNVKYLNSSTDVENDVDSTIIELQTGIGPKADGKLIATRAGKELKAGDIIRNGEVIKYKVEVSNTGTVDITNIQISGQVPEGTTLVVPEPNYEYTGSSYYKELPNKIYETNIETLKVGEVITKEYEVRVNKGIVAGTKLDNITQVKYGDVTKATNNIQLSTEIGNIQVSVKRITDRNIDLYTSGAVQYFAIIENISNEKQEDVKVRTNLPENLDVKRLLKITGMPSEEVSDDDIYITGNELLSKELTAKENNDNNMTTEEIKYSEEINIGTLNPGEIKVLSYDMLIKKAENNSEINFSVTVNYNNEEYNSNNWEDKVENFDIKLSMDTNTEEQYIKSGDVLEYIINVENTSNSKTSGLIIKDNIPTQLTVNKVTINDEEIQGINGNNLQILHELEANTKATIKIETVVNYSEARKEAESITNIATAEVYGEKIATTQEINHIIQANESDNSNNNNNNNTDDSDIAQGTSIITGVAWFDQNADGIKDEGEKILNNIKVRLLNIDTNNLVKDKYGKVVEVVTNQNGIYVLDKISNGKYVAIFDYDNSQYKLTKYKVDGVNESSNSNVLENELTIEGTKQKVASTDIIQIDNNNISNINIGLIELQNFDLKLDKYVSKILIQNSAGTTVREYNNETLAKAEIDAKQINGTTVIIEYKIEVTNNGEVEGYVKKIADYIPNDLKFSSELNKEWYQSGDILYTSSIANDKIKTGETKTLKLTLTKSMTENNTGLVNNTAEIAESYNDLGLEDSNSTPGNRVKGENDMGSADVMLSIRTGGFVYITATVITLLILGAVAYVITKKTSKKEI